MGKVKIGVYALESLTTGMYNEPLDAVREYVQNAADAIREAERCGILQEREGRLMVEVSAGSRQLTLRDNGVGVRQQEVPERLLDIGMSGKDMVRSAGFRGIGRLAGIAYCDKLAFWTSAAGEDVATLLEINCREIRRAMSAKKREVEEIQEVFKRCTALTAKPYRAAEHFFEVCLHGVCPQADSFLDVAALSTYLGQIAPLDFDGQRFFYASKIAEWLAAHRLTIPSVTLVVRSGSVERQIQKPYKTHYRTSARGGAGINDVQVRDVGFYPEAPSADAPFWCWYGITDLLGSIDDSESAGFRLRQHNINLGGADRVAELFEAIAASNRRFNKYFVGEIHVLSPDVIPNARRDGFETNAAWEEIREQLMGFIGSLCEDIRAKSSARNMPTAKVIGKADKVIRDVSERLKQGLASRTERDTLIKRVKQITDTAEKAVAGRTNGQDSETVQKAVNRLGRLEKRLLDHNSFVGRKMPSTLGRKERKVMERVMAVIHDSLSHRACPDREECEKKLRSEIMAAIEGREDGSDE